MIRVADLFAGIGGFHTALSHLSDRTGLEYEVVWACEILDHLRDLYEQNFGLRPDGDITEVKASDVPDIDLLVAGFPCQPFSSHTSSEYRHESHDSVNLFQEILRIVSEKRPQYILLENVPTLLADTSKPYLKRILHGLMSLGYQVNYNVYSPHEFGKPHYRPRVFISCQLGMTGALVALVKPDDPHTPPLREFLHATRMLYQHKYEFEHVPLRTSLPHALPLWRDFYETCIKTDTPIPPFWVSLEEWGANYPLYENMADHFEDNVKGSLGAFGWNTIYDREDLPNRSQHDVIGKDIIQRAYKNRGFYKTYDWTGQFMIRNHERILQTCRTYTKASFPLAVRQVKHNDFGQFIMQPRSSGIQFFTGDVSPCLTTKDDNMPILIDEERHLCLRELAALQGMVDLEHIPDGQKGIKAFGNAVNADLVSILLEVLLIPDTSRNLQPLLPLGV